MQIKPFALERYFDQHEFSARYLLSSSDCEALHLSELLAMADQETQLLWDRLKLGYTESAGHPLLREAIAALYQGLAPSNVLVVVPEEGIFLLMHALLAPGDHVVCTFPAYQSLFEVARSIGCGVDWWEPDERQGWRFDMVQLKDKLRPHTKLVVVNFPHNPTGHLPSSTEYEALIELVRRQGLYLLSDEMYRFLEIRADARLPAACEVYERAFSLCGLSKSFGLPGLRIGWLASQQQSLLARVSMLKDYTTICASAPSEILGIMALRKRTAIIARQLERIRDNLTVLDDLFNAHSDCLSWNRPTGGSTGLARLLREQGAAAFCQRLLREAGIMLVPSTLFQFGDEHVRIGFGRRNLPEVVEHLKVYLDRRYR